MRQIEPSLDERLNRGVCIYCGERLDGAKTNTDHVPTKALLDKPYPPNLPTVTVHMACNNRFSADELYLAVLLGCVLAGSTDVDSERDPSTAHRLRSNPSLNAEIAAARRVALPTPGDPRFWWQVDHRRVRPVLEKNARGHVLFECGDAMLGSPKSVGLQAIELMDEQRREVFEDVYAQAEVALLSEVGSRALVREVAGTDLVGGWVIVQVGVYRYAVIDMGQEVRVRSVIREYLATEVAFA